MEYKVHTTRGLGIVRLTHIATKKVILSSFSIRQEVVSSVNVEHWNAASAAPEKNTQQEASEQIETNSCHATGKNVVSHSQPSKLNCR